MLSSAIITLCRQLAAESREGYISFHGKDPDAEGGDQVEIAGCFTADWLMLRLEGAQDVDKIQCRGIWEEAFFSLVSAGESEGGT